MTDLAVVGGGLAGLSLIHQLLERGHAPREIALIDAAGPERGSDVPVALMHPFPGRSMEPKPGRLESAHASISLLRELAEEVREAAIIELPMIRPLVGDVGDKLLDTWRAARGEYPDWFRSRVVESDELTELEPAMAPFERALVYEPAFSIDTREVAAHLRDAFAEAGVELVDGERVERMRRRNARWQLETKDGVLLDTARVVLAAGFGLRRWFPELPIRGRGGEVLVAEPPAGATLEAIVNASGHVAPRADGAWVAGSTYWDPTDFSARADDEALDDLLRRCARLTPQLKESEPLEIWRGVRAMYRGDNRPLVGPVPELDGLFVFGGLGSKGLLRIPMLAEQLAAFLLDDGDIDDRATTARVKRDKWRPSAEYIAL